MAGSSFGPGAVARRTAVSGACPLQSGNRRDTVNAPDGPTYGDVVNALRRGEPGAVEAFATQYRPVLEAYARKTKIPVWEWPVCVADLLTDEALRLSEPESTVPRNVPAYLVRAVRHRYLYLKRSSSCRERNYTAASDDYSGEWIVSSVCSEAARRMSAGPDADVASTSVGLLRLARELEAGLSAEERFILTWISEGVPRSMIAKWLGMNPDACAKRTWRLCRRLRTQAIERSAGYSSGERREIDRFLRRAGTAAS